MAGVSMSRRECKHAKTCALEWCMLEDQTGIITECHAYVDSGWRPKLRTHDELIETIRKAEEKLRVLRPQFGQREKFERKALGYRGVIGRARRELGWPSLHELEESE